MVFKSIVSVLALCGALASARGQTIRYVDDDAAAGGDGLTWATAHRYLRDAIAAGPVNTEFRIAGGIQRPDLGAGVAQFDRHASFKPKSGAILRGGYRGLAAGGSPDDRDLTAFETVTSGDLMSNDPSSFADNSYHLFEITGSITSITFDGLTVRGGRASANSGTDTYGGGIRDIAGDLDVTNVIFESCMGTYGGAISFQGIQASATGCEFKSCTGLQGAAVRLSGNDGTIDHCLFKSCNPGEGTVQAIGATVTIRDSTFDTGQSAYGGAAIHGLSSAVLVEDSTFAGLDSGGDGGAIFLRDSYTTVRRSVFRDNETSASGGAILAWYGTLSVEDTNFEDNEAYGFGGAIHSRYCDPLVLSGCTCSRNRAVGGSGGGICIEQIGIGAVSVHDCRFVSNTGHDGGAISLHAAANIARCVFSANEGALGGGAIQEDAPPASLTTIDHCTFYGNKNPPGGALRVYGAGKISVSNSLIWKNRVPQIENLGATLTVSYTDIEALPSVYSGNGNFDSFPALYAPALHDFHLRAGSPCIDAGDPAAPVDLDGTRTDIGAIAYQPNYATQPDTYCTAGTSTHGCVPTIGWVGTASASAATAFTITASGLEGQKSGLVFYGTNGSASLPWGITSSLMCVEPPMQRTPVLSSAGTDGNCDGAMSLDWNTFLASTPSALGSPFAAGDVVWAQCWYRDPPAPKTTQLSNALEFVIEP